MGKPRLRMGRRITPAAVLAVAALAALVAIDRGGLLGKTRGDDLSRYDGKEFTVVHDVDGDTFGIDAPDRSAARTTIRLWGVDTPETKKPYTPVQHFGPEASESTRSLTSGRKVRLQLLPGHTRDKYERLLAYVFLPDGRMLNRVLVETGYAYADPRYDHPFKSEFMSLMNRARRDHLGLWAQPVPEDLPYYLRQPAHPATAVP